MPNATSMRKSLVGNLIPGKPPQSAATYQQAMPVFADWCDEVLSGMNDYTKPAVVVAHHDEKPRTPPERQITITETKIERQHTTSVETVSDPADKAEILRLRNRVKEQQEEVSRLLLMIEEMRH